MMIDGRYEDERRRRFENERPGENRWESVSFF
jgi:hypothetical protein